MATPVTKWSPLLYWPWPQTAGTSPDAGLLVWAIWRFQGKPPPGPTDLPNLGLRRYAYWWEFLKWAGWKRRGSPLPRPTDVTPRIPDWGWEYLKAINKAVPPAPIVKPPPPPPPAGWQAPPRPLANAIWDTAGVMVGTWGWDGNTIDEFLSRLHTNGGRYVQVLTWNGTQEAPEDWVREWIDRCPIYEIEFCNWGVGYDTPTPEESARLLVSHAVKYKPRGTAFNAEIHYMGNPTSGGVELERWQRNERFLTQLQRIGKPDGLALALNTLGAASGTNVYWMPHRDWIEAGFDVHAQAYFNFSDDYLPAHCVQHWRSAGYPADRIELTLGCYQAEDTTTSKGLHMHVDDYLPLLAGLSIKGVNLFYAEALDTGRDIGQIPELIKRGHASA